MTYRLNQAKIKGEFTVPDYIVDKHLRLASGEQIKVLLLLLRKLPKALTKEEIAKTLKYNVSDVEDYLQYWLLTGVLEENSEEEETAPEEPEAEKQKSGPEKYIPKASSKTDEPEKKEIEYSRPSSAEIAQRISESKEIADLFNELQMKLGKTIGYDGQCTFMLLHDRFGLSPEVLFMLVDYCVSIGKTGYSYIEAVGKNWADDDIDTIEKAAEKISSLNSVNVFWKKFITVTGINNPKPTAKQLPLVEKWVVDMNMNFDLIVRAYEEMAENTGKIRFSYMNTILEKWHNAGYRTLEDVDSAEKTRSSAKAAVKDKNGTSASYNLDDFKNQAIYKKPKYERKKK